ncbi:ImmA/IrrE family metallo-endopeptidase [Methanobrevibacter smithii]|uniref:ImmA/IrrE family metallo-endopeptidase n=1 Tax=Methanobrevibacter smithii TaxID=2173 RepID=UPI001C010C3F|nr:ImmA/IrrE family metallo-endopeptidase [Methanobrevibacter smithii]MBT9659003.1 ImmA/IrrE family metallo-endopeptidase [Methanobrevibacter smithii]
MSTEIVNVNTKWLKWARTSVKYEKDDVARKLNINPEKITEWEETGELTHDELIALSDVYEVSPYTFFDGNDPVYDKEIPDFRTINSEKIKLTPEIMFELRRAKENRETLLNFEEDFDDFEFPLFSSYTLDSTNPLIVAENIRNLLEMSRSNSHRKLDYWINLMESLGILVFEFYNIEPEQLRGYALYYDKLPIIGINHKESTNAKKFTLFHELAHLIMKKDGISNINEYTIINNDEAYCNKVAAEVLVPNKLFKNYIRDNSSYKKFRVEDIKGLSKIFNVSRQVIVRRALDLGFISRVDYNNRIKEFNEYINPPKKNNSNKNVNSKLQPKKDNKSKDSDKGLHNKAKIALRKNGNYFTSLLIKAYEEDIITDIDMALELKVSLEVMSKIISIMEKEDLYAFS